MSNRRHVRQEMCLTGDVVYITYLLHDIPLIRETSPQGDISNRRHLRKETLSHFICTPAAPYIAPPQVGEIAAK